MKALGHEPESEYIDGLEKKVKKLERKVVQPQPQLVDSRNDSGKLYIATCGPRPGKLKDFCIWEVDLKQKRKTRFGFTSELVTALAYYEGQLYRGTHEGLHATLPLTGDHVLDLTIHKGELIVLTDEKILQFIPATHEREIITKQTGTAITSHDGTLCFGNEKGQVFRHDSSEPLYRGNHSVGAIESFRGSLFYSGGPYIYEESVRTSSHLRGYVTSLTCHEGKLLHAAGSKIYHTFTNEEIFDAEDRISAMCSTQLEP